MKKSADVLFWTVAVLMLLREEHFSAWGKKHGRCPKQKFRDYCEIGNSDCNTDDDCRGIKKCCDRLCINKCVPPLTGEWQVCRTSDCRGVTGPFLEVTPNERVVEEGDSMRTSCYIEDQPFEGWYGPGRRKILSQSTSDNIHIRHMGNGEHHLIISNVMVNHGGKYMCRGAATRGLFTLKVGFIAKKTKLRQYLVLGKTGLIEVAAKGFPVPTYTWKKDGQRIDMTSDRYTVSPSGSLTIKHVQSSDSGQYKLIAKQQLRMGEIKLLDHPYIGVFALSGGCPVPAQNSSDRCNIGVANQCAKDSDCGGVPCCYNGCRYKCRTVRRPASVNLGSCPYLPPPSACASDSDRCLRDGDCLNSQKCCSNSCNKKCVNPSPFPQLIRPGVKLYQQDEYFKQGQQVRRVCRVFNEPFEGWYDAYGRKVTSLEGHVCVKKNGPYHVLIINNVTAEDGGKYTCRGALDSSTVYIKVNFTVVKAPPSFIWLPPKEDICLIKAAIHGYPTPRYIWYRNGMPIDRRLKRYIVSPSGSLTIKGVKPDDMGTYVMKIRQGGELYEPGISVNVQSVAADSYSPIPTVVQCHKKEMVIAVDAKLLEGTSVDSIQLRDPSCGATTNGTYFILRALLTSCGTTVRHTGAAVIYTNAVRERKSVGIVTRSHDINIPFSCYYTTLGVTSTLGLFPQKVSRLVLGSNAATNFDLSVSLFKDDTYSTPFRKNEFPLRIVINAPLYIEVKVDSADTNLAVLAERCYATPTQNPNHPVAYDIIANGCIRDSTLKFYKSVPTKQQFSFRAFQFVATKEKFLFLHCHIVVCNATDPSSRCARGCESEAFSWRLRREAQEERVDFIQGPIIVAEEPRTKLRHQTKQEVSSPGYLWLSIAMVGLCVLCVGAMIYMKRQFSNRRREDVDRKTRNTTAL